MAAVVSFGQVPDLLNALDAAGRAMGVAGSTNATDSTTLSSYANPAGLAYIAAPTFSAAFRNLPESRSVLTGELANPSYQTTRKTGARALSHVGLAMPAGGGVVGIAYTMGGFVRDVQTSGGGLRDGGNSIQNMDLTTKVQHDFFTVSYGRRSGRANYGLGIVLASQYLSNTGVYSIFDSGNNFLGARRFSDSGNSTGFGAVIGAQFQTDALGNSLVGVSLRSPISLSNNQRTSPYLDRIPGRASIGYATRTTPPGDARDYFVYSGQLDYYFSADDKAILTREDVLCGSFGLEYNFFRGGTRIPVRAGYAIVPKGGDRFDNRNTLTFGIGFRPPTGGLSADLSVGVPSGGGGLDTGLSVTYRIGN
jgi:hypothetical protein